MSRQHQQWAQLGPAYPYGPPEMTTVSAGIAGGSAFTAPSLQQAPPAQHASAPSFGSYIPHEPYPASYAVPGRLHPHPAPHAHMPRGPTPSTHISSATMGAHTQQQQGYPGTASAYGAPAPLFQAQPYNHPQPQRMGGPTIPVFDMNYPSHSHPQQPHAPSYHHQGPQHGNPSQYHSAFHRPFFSSEALGGPSSRCSSVTPASQVSTLTIDFQAPTGSSNSIGQPNNDCNILFPTHTHVGFPRHHTPAPFGFTSRTPSPDSIPAPPNLKAMPCANSSQPKFPNPNAPQHANRALPVMTAYPVSTAGGPGAALRETRRFNVADTVPTHVTGVMSILHERNSLSDGRDKPSQPNVTSDPSGNLPHSPTTTSKLPNVGKPAVSVSDATLLLGLRTLSPAGTCASQDTSLTPSLKADHGALTDNSTVNTYDSSMIDLNKAQNGVSEASGASMDPMLQQQQLYIPENYPRRLALDGDDAQLNKLHCYIRRSLLEVFVVPKKEVTSDTITTPSTNSSAGRVGLRCVHCAQSRKTDPSGKNEAPMAVFYPRAMSEIYRLVTSWQRCHLRKCRNLPPTVRAEYETVRGAEKVRGKTSYWADSAKEIGLVDCTTKAGGIRFCPPCEYDKSLS